MRPSTRISGLRTVRSGLKLGMGIFTSYAALRREREDLAEKALLDFAISHHPKRFRPHTPKQPCAPSDIGFSYIKRLFPLDKPLMYSVGDEQSCR